MDIDDEKSVPIADEVTGFFWDAADARRLVLQRCETCARVLFPPAEACPRCGGMSFVLTELEGTGRLFTYCVPDTATEPGYAGDVPYAVARVQLDDCPEVFMTANILDCPLDDLQVDMPVVLAFERRGDHLIPQFRPAVGAR